MKLTLLIDIRSDTASWCTSCSCEKSYNLFFVFFHV